MPNTSVYRTTLATYPTAQECVASILALSAAFKREHKRNASVHLVYSCQFSTDPALGRDIRETHMVTLQADKPEKEAAEIAWFELAIALALYKATT
jgi:hypothetical protein